ncbi:hypothetical protein PQX77_016380 [Marasmius sp. AFHP31]|nr:hypothetical protein PQX77_016380 [Marasmius sp. AFHP31]
MVRAETTLARPETLRICLWTSQDTPSNTDLLLIKRIVRELLAKCSIPLDTLGLDQTLYDESKETMASEFHLPSSVYPWFEKYLSAGVLIATTAYSHLAPRTRVHVAIYSACVTALDDIFRQDPENMGGFSERFAKGLPQDNPMLEVLAKVIQETFQYYGRVQSALIVTSTLDFVTSLSVELEIPRVKNATEFSSFASYCRTISGISVAYGMFIFPADVPLSTYVSCVPLMSTYINCINDVLSFYKEELNMEDDNLASMLAKGSSITKYDAIQRLADDAADADKRVLKALADYPPALDSWQSFRKGYVYFHTSSPRYKLHEVFGSDRVASNIA